MYGVGRIHTHKQVTATRQSSHWRVCNALSLATKTGTARLVSYTDTLIAYLVNQASGSLADAGSIAAVEAAAGALSRAFASAEVQAESWAVDALTPGVLGQIGRDLIRQGGSLHVITLSAGAWPARATAAGRFLEFYGRG